MRSTIIVALGAILFAICMSTMSWSDTVPGIGGGSGSAPPAGAEPITGSPSVPNPGSETPMHDPFTLYDTGPFPWAYKQLETDEQRAVVDRGRDVTGWSGVHDAYATASREAALAAAAAAAQHQLGLEDLGALGVVP